MATKGLQNFSETGCNLLLTAPTGGEGNDQNITTTTLTGLGNVPGSPDYANDFNGTSSAAPLVSGVIATILARKPPTGLARCEGNPYSVGPAKSMTRTVATKPMAPAYPFVSATVTAPG